MLKILGLIFVSLLVGVASVLLDYFTPGTFLITFLGGDFVQTFAAIVGFNMAAIIFLLGQIMTIDPGGATDNFKNTKKEIKDNAIYMLAFFAMSIVLLILRPDYLQSGGLGENAIYYVINIFVIALFVMGVYTVYEILCAAFILTKKPEG